MSDELKEIRLAQARALLDKHGLHDWRVGIADLSRVKTKTLVGMSHGASGVCHWYSKTILIDPSMVNHRNKFLGVVKHEVAHALAGLCAGHGPEWRKIAEKIGCSKKSIDVYRVRFEPPSDRF